MNWREVKIMIDQQASEAVANLLEEAGAGGVVLEEDNDRQVIKAYFHDNNSFDDLNSRLKFQVRQLRDYGLMTGKIDFSSTIISDQDWSKSWHKYFKPLPVGNNFIICPGWESCDQAERIIIKIDPGMAFGVGSHETTQLTIELMEEHINNQIVNMLDIGCGTGILAIVAAKLGVKKIDGIDIDPAAVAASRENIAINRVEEFITINQGDLTKNVEGNYDLITANLLPDLIQRLLPSISPLLAPTGLLILSGIITGKKETIISQLNELDLTAVEEISKNDWVSLVVRKG